jgi:D-alanyl-D-alanine carboxypeptidase (penicillin-binding protein 5/6)
MATVSLLVAVLAAVGLVDPALARSTSHAAEAAQVTAGTTQAASKATQVTAKEAYLIDATAGTIQYAKRETRRVPVASLTKIMTAYVVRHTGSLDDVVTVSKADVRHAATTGATHAGLRAGERLTVRDLLYALLLPSGADAASALARRYGPGVKRFVAKMNRASRTLGLAGTVYTNPDGLPQTGGDHSTAKDQVILAEAVMKDPVIAAVVRTGRHAVGKTAAHRTHVWHNTNRLLPDEAQGLKTGYTRPAGYCLMFASVRGGHTMVGVVLGDTGDAARYRTARKLLAGTVSSDL